MKIKKITCCICGKQEDASQWIESMSRELTDNQMCFTCNHWRRNHEEDKALGEHKWTVVDGGHYRLLPHTDDYFKGFGGRKFKFKFNDGVTVECDNVWFQGDIKDAHPHWREVMPDNAIIIQ